MGRSRESQNKDDRVAELIAKGISREAIKARLGLSSQALTQAIARIKKQKTP
jgi:DNA-binding CsgD family transcriptional regulator